MKPSDPGIKTDGGVSDLPPVDLASRTLADADTQNSDPPTREGPQRFDDHAATTAIGPYRLLEPVGRGGFGVVYRAEQRNPARVVALKLIKRGMDTEAVLSRFNAERQALAMMSHPNISSVFDAGVTDDGRPFFVMEFIDGPSIIDYCNRRRLSIQGRLELFLQVCQAIQHAHAKTIIHRDIKPSNVLVTEQDGQPVAKVIDFGIAKATAYRLTDQTIRTEMGEMLGTPEYMSPEQAGNVGLDIDTRTDVYSLGVLLYELLVGQLPFDSKYLRQVGFEEMRRILCEVEPPKPSARLARLGEKLAAIAAERDLRPAALVQNLRGELEWILMRAMEKDRNRRYETPAELAADISRHLNGETLVAAPPSTSYRLGKFISRYRRAIVVAAGMLLLIAGGVLAYISGLNTERTKTESALREVKQKNEEVERQKKVAEVRRMEAEARRMEAVEQKEQADRDKREAVAQRYATIQEKKNADATLQFVNDAILANATPSSIPDAKARDAIVRGMIDPAAGKIPAILANQPSVEASVRFAIGSLYYNLGKSDRAVAHLDRAAEIRRQELGSTDPGTMEAEYALGSALLAIGRDREALAILRSSSETRHCLFGKDHPETIASMNGHARALLSLKQTSEAELVLTDALQAGGRALRADDPVRLETLDLYARLLHSRSAFKDAEPIFKQVLDARRQSLGSEHPDTIIARSSYASILYSLRRFDEAESLLKSALDDGRRVMGADHPAVISSTNTYAYVLESLNNLMGAEPFCKEAAESSSRVLGWAHPDTIRTIDHYAMVLLDLKMANRAEPMMKRLLEACRNERGVDDLDVIETINLYAHVLASLDRKQDAASFYDEAARRAAANNNLGMRDPTTLRYAEDLASCLEDLRRLNEAVVVRDKYKLYDFPAGPSPVRGSIPR